MMHETVIAHLESLSLSPAAAVFVAAMLPLVEARYAVAMGCALRVPFPEAFALAVLGNLATVIPLLLLLGPLSRAGGRIAVLGKALDWVFARARRREDLIEKYGVLGLTVFIAAPLPVTGAWTGAAMAFVFGLRFWPSMLAMVLGLLVSAGLVSLATYGGVAALGAL